MLIRSPWLRRLIPAVLQKMLTQRLRQLERDGLVLRKHFPEMPPHVEYSVTLLGKSLQPVFASLGVWGHSHIDDVKSARNAFDLRD